MDPGSGTHLSHLLLLVRGLYLAAAPNASLALLRVAVVAEAALLVKDFHGQRELSADESLSVFVPATHPRHVSDIYALEPRGLFLKRPNPLWRLCRLWGEAI